MMFKIFTNTRNVPQNLFRFAPSKVDIATQFLVGSRGGVSEISPHFIHFSCEKDFIVSPDSFKTHLRLFLKCISLMLLACVHHLMSKYRNILAPCW